MKMPSGGMPAIAATPSTGPAEQGMRLCQPADLGDLLRTLPSTGEVGEEGRLAIRHGYVTANAGPMGLLATGIAAEFRIAPIR